MSVQTALPAAIQLILGDQGLDVAWGAKTARWRDSGRHVLLSVVGRPRIGTDERRYAAAVDPDDVTERVYGVRRLVIQVQVETDDQDLDASASELGDVIATGFARSDVLDLLWAEGVGNPRPQPQQRGDYRDDHGDTRSAVVFEIWFNTSRTHTGATIPRLRAAEVSGEIADGGPPIGPVTVGPVD